MEDTDSHLHQQLVRVELLHRFLAAYIQGNLEVFEAILHQATFDPTLQALLLNVFPVYLREEEHINEEMYRAFDTQMLLEQSLSDKRKSHQSLPLTIADVAAKVQVEFILHRTEYTEHQAIQKALNILTQTHEWVTEPIGVSSIEDLFAERGLVVPRSLKQVFLREALHLLQQK